MFTSPPTLVARRLGLAAACAAVLLAPATRAGAQPAWRLGLDVHGTDRMSAARRPLGVAAGLRSGALEGTIVADPMRFLLGWEMLDATLGGWIAGDRVELLAGWRRTSGPFAGRRRYDEALLVGANLTALTSTRFRVEFGAELATSLWRHGAGVPDNTIDLAVNAELATRVSLLLHLRFVVLGAL